MNGHQSDDTNINISPSSISSNDTIEDNLITRIGEQYQDSVGINAGFVDGLSILHNDIHNVPSDGIILGRTLNEFVPTVCTVEWNNVYDFKEVTSDGGGIYTSGLNWNKDTGKGTIIEDNYVHDVWRPASADGGANLGSANMPIYLDHHAVGVDVESNAVYSSYYQMNVFNNSGHPGTASTSPSASSNRIVKLAPGYDSSIIAGAGPDEYDQHRIEAEDYTSAPGTTPHTTATSGNLTNGTALNQLHEGDTFTYSFDAPELAAYQFSIDIASSDSAGSGDYVALLIDGGATASTQFSLSPTGGAFQEEKRPGTIAMPPGPHTFEWIFHGSLSTVSFDSFSFGPAQAAEAVDNIQRSGWPGSGFAVIASNATENPDGVVQFGENNESITLPLVVPYTGDYILGLRTATLADNAKLQIVAAGQNLGTFSVPHTPSTSTFYTWYFGQPTSASDVAVASLTPSTAFQRKFLLSAGLNLVTLTFLDPVPVQLLLDTVYVAPVFGVAAIG